MKKKKSNKSQKLEKNIDLLNVNTEKDLVHLLQADSHPRLSESQWNKLRKRIKKLLMKLTKNNTCDLNEKKFLKLNSKIKLWTHSL